MQDIFQNHSFNKYYLPYPLVKVGCGDGKSEKGSGLQLGDFSDFLLKFVPYWFSLVVGQDGNKCMDTIYNY